VVVFTVAAVADFMAEEAVASTVVAVALMVVVDAGNFSG
jgi:hypothetical protein